MRVRAVAGVLSLGLGALALAPGAQAKPGELIVARHTGPPALLNVNPLNGHIHSLATGPGKVWSACYVAFEPNGLIAVTDEGQNPGQGKIWIANPSTGKSRVLALSGAAVSEPYGIATDAKGNLIVADYDMKRVVSVSKSGHVRVLSSGPWLGLVYGVAVDRRTGTIYVLDSGGAVDRLSPKGHLSTLASGPPLSTDLWAIARAPGGALYVTDLGNHQLDRVNPKTGAVHKVASLPGGAPFGVAAASNRILYTTDFNAGTVSRVNVQTGHVTPVANGLTNPLGILVKP